MSALSPGLYRATVRGIPGESIVMVGDDPNAAFSLAPDSAVRRCYVFTDARPLVTLDLENPGEFVHILRGVGIEGDRNHRAADGTWVHIINGSISAKRLGIIADQIEAQTKPARIPEPGLWGVVEAVVQGDDEPDHFARIPKGGSVYHWVRISDGLNYHWDDLIDPTLIRDGLS